MPPRRTVPASPATSARRTVEPSPAPSTRSTRRRPAVDESDDWERESMVSTASFKVPNPRGKKAPVFYPSDTSVQIAAAFNAAQTGQHAAPSARSRTAPSHRKTPSASASAPQRALSPAESILSSARALSPVRYFLRPADESEEHSGEFNSFGSLGNANGNGGDRSGETSYSYMEEEEFVRAAQQSARDKTARVSDGRRKKGRNDDMPYRPGRDDEVHDAEDESDEGGEGIVRQGGLNGRAGTRGQRAERGEGYLGNGLGIQPKDRKSRKSGGMETDEGIGRSGEEDEDENEGGKEAYEHRGYSHSPFPDRNGRSTTPMQAVRSTLTPRPVRGSTPLSRRRQPSAARTIATNILHGIAMSLRFVVDLLHSILSRAILRPLQKSLGPSRAIVRRLKQDWWKYVLGMLALSLAVRFADKPWRSNAAYTAPTVPPSSMEELVARLTSIENALSSISSANRALEQGEAEGRKASEAIVGRVGEVENVVAGERKRLEIFRVGGEKGQAQLQSSLESIKQEVDQLASRVGATEVGLQQAGGRLKKLDEVDREVQSLKERMGTVERDVLSVLDDGKLRNALVRILPDWMPVRKNDKGGVDIDPVFWTEMRRVMVGQGEVESLVRKVIGGVMPDHQSTAVADKQLDEWAAKLYDAQVARGDVISRSEFLRVLEGELSNLKTTMAEIRARSLPPVAPSAKVTPVTIKSHKGDDLTSAMQQLVDAALWRYSKDIIARPDYALFTAGGRVVPSITSDTLIMSSPGVLGRVVLGRKAVEGLSPAHALMPDNTVGKCWPFKGDRGQLGVMLSRRVTVKDLTLEHAASEVAVDIRSAPRDVEVWGLVEGPENMEKAREYQESHSQEETASMPPSPDYLLLSTFAYDPSLPNHIQTFPVKPEIQALGIDMGIVVFKFSSNWGGDFTCLYRVRVHGDVKLEE